MTRSILRTPRLGTVLLMVALSAAPALAQAEGSPGQGRLTPAQKQKLFPGLRALQLQSNQARIGILQRNQQCLSAAGSMEALRSCMQQERQATMSQRQQNREAIRRLYESNGVPVPQLHSMPGSAS
ncbi:MAG: hypothetical protein ACKO0M_15265 [Cyanobium sp.]